MSLFRESVDLSRCAAEVPLHGYTPELPLENLLTGVDNLRHDVLLSGKFMAATRVHIQRMLAKCGGVTDLCADPPAARPASIVAPAAKNTPRDGDSRGFADIQAGLLSAALTRAKSEDNPSLETLCWLAVVKFLRQELSEQFTAVLERCQLRLKACEDLRPSSPQKPVALRERVARFQLAKKAIQRQVGQELLASLRDVEVSSLAGMRRSLFGNRAASGHEIFGNRLLLAEDGADDFLCAHHYIMLGKRSPNDPDRFPVLEAVVSEFFHSLGYRDVSSLLNEPENVLQLFPDAPNPLAKAVLGAWIRCLEKRHILDRLVAAYEVVPLLAEYCPLLHPQQLKGALVTRAEQKQVKDLLGQGQVPAANFLAAVRKIKQYSRAEREKVAIRFLRDFLCYRRDLQRLEVLNRALDTVALASAAQLQQLSKINHTLYEFLFADEQQPREEEVTGHVILKADIRDSTRLTRTLFDRGLNPASYFSLNFYEPVNKLLSKYGAQKLFLEGDALIVALLERSKDSQLAISRACGLAKEIIEIVRGYNQLSTKSGLPALELGIGISYQDTPPMYLIDGSTPIMISPAINASDRLSSCSKSARHLCAGVNTVFNVFAFQTVDDEDTAGQPEEFLVRYNVGGIVLDEAAFCKLRQEISLTVRDLPIPSLWGEEAVRFHSGTVPVLPGIVHRLAVREARVPHIDAREFSLKCWTERKYFEVCTDPAVYELLETEGIAKRI